MTSKYTGSDYYNTITSINTTITVSNYLIYDDFSTSTDNWSNYGGAGHTRTVGTGMTCTGSSEGVVVYNTSLTGNYTVEFTVKSGDYPISCVLGFTNSNSSYILIDGDGTTDIFGCSSLGNFTQITTLNGYSFSNGDTFKLVKSGTTVTIYKNNSSLGSFSTSSYSLTGKFGLRQTVNRNKVISLVKATQN